jgi:beta-lactamase class A
MAPTSRPSRTLRRPLALVSLAVRRASLAALTVVALVLIGGCSSNDDDSTGAPSETSPPSRTPADISADEFEKLESTYDARLGVYAVDTGTEQEIEYRADERFGHASTFKALLCGIVLQQNSIDDLDRVIRYTSDDLVFWSPITERNIDTGMSIGDLCEAAVGYSDNTATNLLLNEIGGPSGLQEALRENGDDVISTDRYEIEMSEAAPGDTRDTSTPRSIGTSLRTFVLDDALPEDKRAMLTDWLVENTTGAELIRAGVPDDWVVGDKTGNGGYGTRNDIAVAWPPGGDPVVIAVLSSRDQDGADHDDQLIADAAGVVVDALAETSTRGTGHEAA